MSLGFDGRRRSSRFVTTTIPILAFLTWTLLTYRHPSAGWLLCGLISIVFAAAGYLVLRFDPNVGSWFVAAGSCWAIGGWQSQPTGWWRVVAAIGWLLFWMSLACCCFQYTGSGTRRPNATQIWVLALTALAAATAAVARRDGLTWWIAAFIILSLLGVECVLLGRRFRGLSPVRRALAGPVVAATLLAAVTSWALWVGARRVQYGALAWPGCLHFTVIFLVAAAVWVAATRRRLARIEAAGLLEQIGGSPTVERVQEILRQSLRDPSATVLYRVPHADSYVGGEGQPVDVPPSSQRLVVPAVVGPAGSPAVVLVHFDPTLDEDLALVEIAVTTCGPALANARLQVINRALISELRRSRTRIVTSAVAERRRLERNLHDGAQQSLLAVSTRLSTIGIGTMDARLLVPLDAARAELRHAVQDLRSLTRDLYPALLKSEGLRSALEEAVDEWGWDVRVTAPSVRLAEDIETAAYLTVAELLTGLQRGRHAFSAEVTITVDAKDLILRIVHDQAGEPINTEWLKIATDRLRAIDGDLLVDTGRPGLRGVLIARIPCE